MTRPHTFNRNGPVDYILWSCDAAPGVQHIEVPAAQSFPASQVVINVPGNGVDSVGQCSRVDVEEADRSAAICVARKHAGDVGPELIVSRMADGHAIDH